MCELTKNIDGIAFHQRLLVTVSVLSLFGIVAATVPARAGDSDADNPVVWIELGGQLERVDGGVERFAPPFFDKFSPKQLTPPIDLERPSRFSNGADGKITFHPSESSWLFTASVRYGRTQSKRHLHQEYGFGTPPPNGNNKYLPQLPNLQETTTSDHESHMFADFQAGKDVGLGMFGQDGSSTISFGIRVAQFHTSDTLNIAARPQQHLRSFTLGPNTIFLDNPYNYYASASTTRSFQGIGPSLEWKNSTLVIGSLHDGGISFDWGVNGSVLFGRQKTRGTHQASGGYQSVDGFKIAALYHDTGHPDRRSSVVIPNAGAFAGFTYRVEDFKLCLGYRGDFFFGAVDGGIDTRKSTDRNFYGPFASISVGLGG